MEINHVSCSWSMIELQIPKLGQDLLITASAINYNAEKQVETNYGLGGQPVGRGIGKSTYEASITLPIETIIQLRNLENNDTHTLMGLGSFDIIISWQTTLTAGAPTETVTLKDCFFSEAGMDADTDATAIKKEYKLNPYRIYTDASAQTDRTAEMCAV